MAVAINNRNGESPMSEAVTRHDHISLAEELGYSSRHIREFAKIACELSGVEVKDPCGGYTPEGVAEIKRGLKCGGPKSYEKVLMRERKAAQSQSAISQPSSAEPPSSATVSVML